MKIIFMGTPEFAVPALVEIYNKGFNIPFVISQTDKKKGRGKKTLYTPVKEKALNLGLEVYQPEDINSKESIEKIKEASPDFIVVVAYGQILKEDILNIPKYDALNIHASLLPLYRGPAPLNWVIINGEEETGITIMKMAKGLDTGDMIIRKPIHLSKDDDPLTIGENLSKLGGQLIIEAIELISKDKAIYTPQDHKKSTYAPLLTKELGKINWEKPPKDIVRLVKGLKPWPMAYTLYKGDQVKIHESASLIKEHDEPLGKIVKVSKDEIWVAAKGGYLIIKKLQFPGKKMMDVKTYLMGNQIEEGYIL